MDKLHVKYSVDILDELTPTLRTIVSNFRTSVPDINGKIRTPKEEIIHQEKFCSDSDIKLWILVFEKNMLIGTTAVYARSIKYNGRNILLGGIGKVRVKQENRGEGIASAMMEAAMDQMKKLKCDIAFLDTNIDSFLGKFYKKYGFVPLNRPYTFLGKSRKRYSDTDGMIAQITSKALFTEILTDSKPFDIGFGNW